MSFQHIRMRKNSYDGIDINPSWMDNLYLYSNFTFYTLEMSVPLLDILDSTVYSSGIIEFPSKKLSTIYNKLLSLLNDCEVFLISSDRIPNRWLWDSSVQNQLFEPIQISPMNFSKSLYKPLPNHSNNSHNIQNYSHELINPHEFLRSFYNCNLIEGVITSSIYFMVNEGTAKEAFLFYKLQMTEDEKLTEISFSEFKKHITYDLFGFRY